MIDLFFKNNSIRPASPRFACDLLLAPHHGTWKASDPTFFTRTFAASRNVRNKQWVVDGLSANLNFLRTGDVTVEFWDRLLKDLKETRKKKYEDKRTGHLKELQEIQIYYYEDLFIQQIRDDAEDQEFFDYGYRSAKLTTRQRYDMLIRLVRLATEIIEQDNAIAVKEFDRLEDRLISNGGSFDLKCAEDYLFRDAYNPHWTFPAAALLHEFGHFVEELHSEIKFIVAILRANIKQLFRNLKSDLRFRYRSIIRFLFKNMDDESGDYNNQNALWHKRLFFNLISHSTNGNKRYNYAFTINRQKWFAFYLN